MRLGGSSLGCQRDVRFQLARGYLADGVGNDAAFPVEVVGLGEAREPKGVVGGVTAVADGWVVGLVALEEAACVASEVLHVDAEERHGACVPAGGGDEAWGLVFAGPTPGRPEVEDDWVAVEFLRREPFVGEGSPALARPGRRLFPDDREVERRR